MAAEDLGNPKQNQKKNLVPNDSSESGSLKNFNVEWLERGKNTNFI